MQMWVDEYAGDSLLTRYRLAGSSDEQKRLVKNCLLKHFQHNWSVFCVGFDISHFAVFCISVHKF